MRDLDLRFVDAVNTRLYFDSEGEVRTLTDEEFHQYLVALRNEQAD